MGPSVRRSVGPLVRRSVGQSVMIELESVKTRISAPAHPSATDGCVSGPMFLNIREETWRSKRLVQKCFRKFNQSVNLSVCLSNDLVFCLRAGVLSIWDAALYVFV